MRLVEEGKRDLDVPVRTYVPELRLADKITVATVTVRNLLQHAESWEGNLFEDTGHGDDALAVYITKMAEFPQLAPLGTLWSYNNAAFSIAWRVIEAMTGKAYESDIKELVLVRLG